MLYARKDSIMSTFSSHTDTHKEKTLGEKHPDVLCTHNQLTIILWKTKVLLISSMFLKGHTCLRGQTAAFVIVKIKIY